MIEELKALAERATDYTGGMRGAAERQTAREKIVQLVLTHREAILSAISAVPEMKEALEEADYALKSASRFIFEKHGTTNQCRKDAIEKISQALAALEPKP